MLVARPTPAEAPVTTATGRLDLPVPTRSTDHPPRVVTTNRWRVTPKLGAVCGCPPSSDSIALGRSLRHRCDLDPLHGGEGEQLAPGGRRCPLPRPANGVTAAGAPYARSLVSAGRPDSGTIDA